MTIVHVQFMDTKWNLFPRHLRPGCIRLSHPASTTEFDAYFYFLLINVIRAVIRVLTSKQISRTSRYFAWRFSAAVLTVVINIR